MDLHYGLHWDRDFLVDIEFRVQSILPIVSLLTIYPACFYLLLVEGPTMISEIRAAYIAHSVVHILFDVVFSFLMRTTAFPPYGLFYCEGILCTSGLKKPTLIAILASVIIMGIPTYVFLMMRKLWLFGASCSIFVPPVIFLATHAMRTLKRASAASTKTQQLTRKLFIVFQLQV
ncbi:hypothetical protein PENTCL1PPCAC_16245, partial [Pristionchus entomophagus]